MNQRIQTDLAYAKTLKTFGADSVLPPHQISPLAKLLDSTLIKPTTTSQEIRLHCEEALSFGIGAVCVAPYHVPLAHTILAGSSVEIATVLNFPHGNLDSATLLFQVENVVKNGAVELDIVQNIGLVKEGSEEKLFLFYSDLTRQCSGILKKLIMETALLTPSELAWATELACRASFDIIKTSTGFSTRGASVEDVKTIHSTLLRSQKADHMGIKASGGVSHLAQVLTLINAGATRIGTSSAKQILMGTPPNTSFSLNTNPSY
jgi:deoxyribose-phosphate aldolase